MNLQQQEQFYQMVTRLRANSRAASVKGDARVTEIVSGLIVSKPKSKAASVPGINKAKAIHDFFMFNGRH